MGAKNLFELPYAGIDHGEDYDLLIGTRGEFSVIIEIVNPVIRFSADPAGYHDFHLVLNNLVKILGEEYLLQKHDIISRQSYEAEDSREYLQTKYHAHFKGRDFLRVTTYLTITRQVRKNRFYTYDPRLLAEFKLTIGKVLGMLPGGKPLREAAINHLVIQILAMHFGPGPIALDNLEPNPTMIRSGDRAIRSITLVNIDTIDLPPEVSPHIALGGQESIRGFPVDLLSFLFDLPDCDALVYHQVIGIPQQAATLRKLEQKKKRHAGIPDPANQLCVADIERLLNDVARDNQMLVNSHFNILVSASQEKLAKAANAVENALFNLGIIPSRNAYNQLELFRSALPGNGVELKPYDWFLTTSEAAACFFFKESLPVDELSDFIIRFTDRQGIPVGIDPADLPMRTGRINNRNKFVLGPSGSGKSFFMNALIEQYMMHDMDVVIVDTGHSYSGLCSYYQGKYITYSEQCPITMNPFRISREEFNIEKKDFLCTLAGLLWKGAEGNFSQVERDVLSQVVSAYYQQYFEPPPFPGLTSAERLAVKSGVLDSLNTVPVTAAYTYREWDAFFDVHDRELSAQDDLLIDAMTGADGELNEGASPFRAAFLQKYRAAIREATAEARRVHEQGIVRTLNFNSFYEFALRKIPRIKQDEQIPFDLDEFRFVMKKYYKGGEFAAILNEAADSSLFRERFIVFEIDAIKENRILFPIVTLIIMDVFIQKMRFRSGRRKALIVEEAWKAIASPLMAGYLLYLYKTVRKFWGEAIVVTQELADILGNPVVKDSILNNSDTVCLLDQTKFRDNYDAIAALLAISETERRKIFTINQLDNRQGRGPFKEVYVRRGTTGEVYGVEVSLHQYLTYTTEKPEKTAVEYYLGRFGSYQEGLDAFVEDFKRSGQSLSSFVAQINQQSLS